MNSHTRALASPWQRWWYVIVIYRTAPAVIDVEWSYQWVFNFSIVEKLYTIVEGINILLIMTVSYHLIPNVFTASILDINNLYWVTGYNIASSYNYTRIRSCGARSGSPQVHSKVGVGW